MEGYGPCFVRIAEDDVLALEVVDFHLNWDTLIELFEVFLFCMEDCLLLLLLVLIDSLLLILLLPHYLLLVLLLPILAETIDVVLDRLASWQRNNSST